MDLKLWPWEKGEKPYWVNPENGLEWYHDKTVTDWARGNDPKPKLNAVGFIIAERDEDTINPQVRVLLDGETNEVLHQTESLEGMAIFIDLFKITKE